jgi:hypothetical protein
VDGPGNYLGPDYGHAIAVTVDGTLIQTPPRDLLDGSYVFPLNTTRPPASTTVKVTVLGRPLYDGPLSGIPSGHPSRFAFSAHAGVAIPVRGFASAASSGLLLELDAEYRITPCFSIEGVVGRYDFSSASAITGGTVSAKGYFGSSGWRPYAAAGAGIFKPGGVNAGFGLVAAAGVNHPFGTGLELDFAAQYMHVFRSGGLGFLGFKAGVKVAF